MKIGPWVVFFLLINGWSVLAQPYTSRNLSIQQGLPEYYVSGLVQDKAGFIWVATRDGLARYDGRQFKVFRHRPFNNRSLADNVILSLKSVSDTTLVLGLENGGCQLFNPVTEQFTKLVSPQTLEKNHLKLASATLIDNQNQLWSRYETQLIHLNRQTNRFQVYPFPPLAASGQFPGHDYLIDEQYRLFAPVPGHLLEFDVHRRTFQSWPHSGIGFPGTVPTYYGTQLVQRTNGEILLGAPRQLLAFHPQTHRFRSIPIPSPLDTKVGLLYQAEQGPIYFTYGMSVYRLSADDTITLIWTAPRTDYQNYFHALLLDRSGVLWIGTNGDGIQQIDLRALAIKTYPYRTNFFHDVLTDELGLSMPAWSITDSHLYNLRLDGSAPFLSIYLDKSYQLLQGNRGRRTLQSVLKMPPTTRIIGIDGGNGLRVSPDGTIWLYDPHRGLLKADSSGRLLDTFVCSINWVTAIQPLGDQVWVGSGYNGLYAYDLKSRHLVRHLRYQPTDSSSLISNQVLCLAPDPTNPALLWVGTPDGLCRLDTRTMRFQNWTDQQGLLSATINTLVIDQAGNLWFSTVKGITRLDPRRLQMRHYTTADGLLDIEYRQNQVIQLPDGRLAFGGATGVTIFHPLALNERVEPIPTVLTRLQVDNRPVEPAQPGSPLRLPLNATSMLRLRPTQNFLSLEFAGLQYNKPSSLRYRYQLTGVDDDWVNAGAQTVANYTQLAPGTYEFRVNTADASGRWSPLVKTLQIIIDPPWWQTGWAYAVYVLMLAGLVQAYGQYRINRAQLRQERLLQEQEARLIKENADWQTRFFTNITHEFRTPLTLIISPLQRLIESSTQPSRTSLQHQYGVMNRNAHRLLRLINQLLDVAKLEAGQLGVIPSRGNLTSFFGELVDSFRPRAERKAIQLTFEAHGLPADAQFDATKLETIGYNLLANAIKFTPEGGHIRVRLATPEAPAEPAFELQIIDSGIGIPPDQLPHIFDRFFQGRQADSNVGTGIGLFLVAEFTKLLGGTVQVESQVGQGTAVTVTLPLHPSADPPMALAPVSPPLRPTVLPPETVVGAQPATPSADAPLVLVVEDNDELREFIAGELAGNYRVLTAANGQEGWQVCLAELPELVISDVMMPVPSGPLTDGFALVEQIKTTPLTAHIAVMLLTAKTMSEARIQGLKKGANDYLTKPFNAQELLLRIANLVQHQQQLRLYWQLNNRQLDAAKPVLPGPVVDDPFLIRFYQVLDQELSNSAYSIDQLADELAVSHRTLNRKLSTLTGSHAIELMRSYRLRKAALFLQQGCSITEAAEKTGFDGLPYFSRSFKAQFDVSPSVYLKAQHKAD